MELNSATWRKSTYSGGNGGGCVEVGAVAGVIAVRDTKLPGTSPVLSFAPDAWRAFAADVKNDSAVLVRHFQRSAGPIFGRGLLACPGQRRHWQFRSRRRGPVTAARPAPVPLTLLVLLLSCSEHTPCVSRER